MACYCIYKLAYGGAFGEGERGIFLVRVTLHVLASTSTTEGPHDLSSVRIYTIGRAGHIFLERIPK